MALSRSPTVRRRRLAAELRRLRGKRTGSQVSRGVGWSATKISRAESGHESLPPAEVGKLLDFYGVEDPFRSRLLELAEDATQRGWWDDYADALNPQFLEFVGLEAEAVSSLQWQADVVPGLLQTKDYAQQLRVAYQTVVPTTLLALRCREGTGQDTVDVPDRLRHHQPAHVRLASGALAIMVARSLAGSPVCHCVTGHDRGPALAHDDKSLVRRPVNGSSRRRHLPGTSR